MRKNQYFLEWNGSAHPRLLNLLELVFSFHGDQAIAMNDVSLEPEPDFSHALVVIQTAHAIFVFRHANRSNDRSVIVEHAFQLQTFVDIVSLGVKAVIFDLFQ